MLSIYLTIDAVTVTLLLMLAGLALSRGGYKRRLNRLLAGFAVALTIWLPSNHIGNYLGTPRDIAIFFNHLVFASSFVAGIILVKIVILIANIPRERRIMDIAEWFLWPFAIISATPLVGKDIERQESVNGVVFGPLGDVYGLLLIVIVLFMVHVIIRGLRVKTGNSRKQLKSVSIVLMAVIPLVLILSYVLPATTGVFIFTEFGVTPMVFLVFGLYYSVVRHGLFDIKLASVRALGYSLSLAVVALVYIALAYAFSLLFLKGSVVDGVSFSPINIVLALVLALIFQPIKQFFDRVTNSIFYRSDYNSEVFFREFGRILSFDTDLRLLLRQVSAYISKNLKTESVFFYIVDRGVFSQKGMRKTHIPEEDIVKLTKYYLKSHEAPEAIVFERIDDEEIAKILLSHQAQIILPLVLQDQAIGFLFIGDHKSRGYTIRDIKVLESVANELTIAVQNSLSVEEIRDLNQSLQLRVDEATAELRSTNRQLQRLDEAKNEFISMASHQLRTPLTSIKGYLDMVLQGDLGRVSATQRTVLSEAFLSSERMVALINDFLNVSRLQTGKFTIERRDSDLVTIIKEQLQMLSVVAKQYDLKLDTKLDTEALTMSIDEDKIRQVVLNFIDNAIYYSTPNSTIQIILSCTKDKIIFKVVDSGIGVPKNEQSGLFTKFYRASNARKRRPDGTGVGLFLAKKVIFAHSGEMIFESMEGKGSTFGFSLPTSLLSKEASPKTTVKPKKKATAKVS